MSGYRVVLEEMHERHEVAARDREQARYLARDLLSTMWRRPGATLAIVEDVTGGVVWRWTGRADDQSFNAWRIATHIVRPPDRKTT